MSDQGETRRQEEEQQEVEEEVIVIEIEDDASEQDLTDERTCWGCRNGILNQLGHVDPGGCLYFEPYEDDEVIETMSVAETVKDAK